MNTNKYAEGRNRLIASIEQTRVKILNALTLETGSEIEWDVSIHGGLIDNDGSFPDWYFRCSCSKGCRNSEHCSPFGDMFGGTTEDKFVELTVGKVMFSLFPVPAYFPYLPVSF